MLEVHWEHCLGQLRDALDHEGVALLGPGNDILMVWALRQREHTSSIRTSFSTNEATVLCVFFLLVFPLIILVNNIVNNFSVFSL